MLPIVSTPFARERAKSLRQESNIAEKILWNKLRAKKFLDYKFRRQVPIGRYIVDFLCVQQKLIIEIDGDSHYQDGAQEYDKKRDAYLLSQGFQVLRVSNRQTLNDSEAVFRQIWNFLSDPSP